MKASVPVHRQGFLVLSLWIGVSWIAIGSLLGCARLPEPNAGTPAVGLTSAGQVAPPSAIELENVEAGWREAIALAKIGAFFQAEERVMSVLTEALEDGAPRVAARLRIGLGEFRLARGDLDGGRAALTRVLDQSKGFPAEEALVQSALAQLERRARNSTAAARLDDRAMERARAAEDPDLLLRVALNAAQGSLESGDAEAAGHDLAAAIAAAETIDRVGAMEQLALGNLVGRLSRVRGTNNDSARVSAGLRLRAFKHLQAVLATKEATPALRGAAYLSLGELYADEERFEEAARAVTRSALEASRAGDDLTRKRSHHLRARYAAAQGRMEEAESAYQEALSLSDALRRRDESGFSPSGGSFRDGRGGVYYDFAQFLLDRHTNEDDPALLRRVREIIESLKSEELRDYFGNACVDRAVRATKSVDELAVGDVLAVYPIVLAHRVEILVTHAGQIERFTVPVEREQVRRAAKALRRSVESSPSRAYLRPAASLYDWFVRPYAHLIKGEGSTLVFVSDETLRSVPLAALYDGESFLIERAATVIAPALHLIDPYPLDLSDLAVLAGGVSESVQGFVALPNVRDELARVESQLGARVLLDDEFTLENWQRTVRSEPWGLVHIATHAQFGENSQDSFLLTHEGRIGLDRLGELIGEFASREQPLELLTLSACETAAGSDRAALGLSGVAIQSGARSVLGTLWTVDDRATTILIDAFYSRLRMGEISRAEALRAAQRELLQDDRLRHPAFWSPFVLINNWM